ncbi:MAG: MFS transporter [bacterium]|nr:MFS transporter [bacterium]
MKINHVIRTLIFSDFYLNMGLGLFGPIFAIFITKQIAGGSIEVVGFAAGITQIFKVILQIPIAKYLDKNHGEYDDFYSMILGGALISLAPFLYLMASQISHIYLIQALYGVGLAFLVPPWYAIFSRHLDKLHENIEWSFESVSIGIATAASAAIGGIVANRFGFHTVFIVAGILSFFSIFNQLKIYKDLKEKVKRGTVKPV